MQANNSWVLQLLKDQNLEGRLMDFIHRLQLFNLHGLESIKLLSDTISDFENLSVGSLVELGLCEIFIALQDCVD